MAGVPWRGPRDRVETVKKNSKPAKCLSCAPPLHRPDENIENYKASRVRIDTLSDLVDAASARKSVVCPGSYCWEKPKPAAVVINLNGLIIYRLLNQGIYIYQKPKP